MLENVFAMFEMIFNLTTLTLRVGELYSGQRHSSSECSNLLQTPNRPIGDRREDELSAINL
jgi:hypothetical protein